jgi:quercetin dioxygenase-like cupin family protein
MTYLYRAGLGAVIAALLFGGPQLSAVDQPKTDPIVKDIQQMLAAYPSNIKLLFENEYVWVLEYRLRPGDALPVHDLGNHAVYALGDHRLLFLHNYEPSAGQWTAGEVHWYRCEPHEVKNVGKTVARYLAVARKPFPLGEAPRIEPETDLIALASQGAKELLKNPHMRILEVTVAPGETQPVHQGLYRVVYSLASYQIRMAGSEHQFRPGDTHFHGPGGHAVENTGQTWARYLVFELRQ